jgi:hypothetical protein
MHMKLGCQFDSRVLVGLTSSYMPAVESRMQRLERLPLRALESEVEGIKVTHVNTV